MEQPFRFDVKLTDAQIRQFAGEIRHMKMGDIRVLEDKFDGDRSPEFYRGLLAGYYLALQVTQLDLQKAVPTLAQIVAFIADRIERLEGMEGKGKESKGAS